MSLLCLESHSPRGPDCGTDITPQATVESRNSWKKHWGETGEGQEQTLTGGNDGFEVIILASIRRWDIVQDQHGLNRSHYGEIISLLCFSVKLKLSGAIILHLKVLWREIMLAQELRRCRDEYPAFWPWNMDAQTQNSHI